MVKFHFEAGDPLEVPAFWIMPHAGDFWGDPMIVIEVVDPAYPYEQYQGFACVVTRPMEPWDDHSVNHFAYTGKPGDVTVVNFDDPDDEPRFRRTVYWKHLGVYRAWDVRGDDKREGLVKLVPVIA
jgi:hypothetical protein